MGEWAKLMIICGKDIHIDFGRVYRCMHACMVLISLMVSKTTLGYQIVIGPVIYAKFGEKLCISKRLFGSISFKLILILRVPVYEGSCMAYRHK